MAECIREFEGLKAKSGRLSELVFADCYSFFVSTAELERLVLARVFTDLAESGDGKVVAEINGEVVGEPGSVHWHVDARGVFVKIWPKHVEIEVESRELTLKDFEGFE